MPKYIKPYAGEAGTMCLMMQKNIPVSEPGWKAGKCPICKEPVWITPDAAAALKDNPQLKGACTECAIRGATQDRSGMSSKKKWQ